MAQQLTIEVLEERNLLSGSVTASIVAGDLIVTGDVAANEVRILDNGEGGLVVVGQGGTEINGVADGRFDTTTTTPDAVEITLSGGDDVLDFRGSNLTGDVTVTAANGNDTLEFLQADGQILNVNGGNDTNSIKLGQSNFLRLIYNGGAVTDTIEIVASSIGESSNINLGEGDDTATVRGSDFGKAALIKTGIEISDNDTQTDVDRVEIRRTDFKNSLRVDLGDQADTLVADQITVRFATLVLADFSVASAFGGADGVKFKQSRFGTDLTFNGFADNDLFIVEKSEVARNATARTHGGNDVVSLEFTEVEGRTTVDFGTGNDTGLSFRTAHNGILNAFGRAGEDVLMKYGANFGDLVRAVGGEDNDEIYSVAADFAGDVSTLGQGGDDFISSDFNLIRGDSNASGAAGTDTINGFFGNQILGDDNFSAENLTDDVIDYKSIADAILALDVM